jgi:acetylornithine deacetylase/succinyl-diaminopimelate desuccinylase-like protein
VSADSRLFTILVFRYEFTFKGPGGRSFQEFGLPSAIHAMGRAIAKISELQPPSDPRTTFTVGTVTGGTSVNAIAAEARMAVDMRSNATDELLKLEGAAARTGQGGGRG